MQLRFMGVSKSLTSCLYSVLCLLKSGTATVPGSVIVLVLNRSLGLQLHFVLPFLPGWPELSLMPNTVLTPGIMLSFLSV